MHFRAEHRFHQPPPAVAAVLADPAFYTRLELPDVGTPEVLDHQVTGSLSVLRLRYEFVGNLDPVARRLVGRSRLAWVQGVEVDRSGAGRLTFAAEADPRHLRGSAEFTIVPDGSGCVRRLSGEVVVAVPAVGPWAERRIVPGLLRRLDIEARAIEARLAG